MCDYIQIKRKMPHVTLMSYRFLATQLLDPCFKNYDQQEYVYKTVEKEGGVTKNIWVSFKIKYMRQDHTV